MLVSFSLRISPRQSHLLKGTKKNLSSQVWLVRVIIWEVRLCTLLGEGDLIIETAAGGVEQIEHKYSFYFLPPLSRVFP